MFAMHQEGNSTHTIAKELGRSTRTVHQVLTGRGTHSLPERDWLPDDDDDDDEDEEEVPSRSPRPSRRRKKEMDGEGGESRAQKSFLEKVEPMIAEGAAKHLRDHPEFALQAAASVLGIKLEKPSLEGIAMEAIKDDPNLRREWAEMYLVQTRRNGRSELDILSEGMDILCTLVERMHRPTTIPDVLSQAVRTGELTKVVETLLRQAKPHEASPLEPSPVDPSPPTQVAEVASEPKLPSYRRLRNLPPEAREKYLAVIRQSFPPIDGHSSPVDPLVIPDSEVPTEVAAEDDPLGPAKVGLTGC